MKSAESILVLGHRGHLGRCLLAAAQGPMEVIEGGRKAFDLSRAGMEVTTCSWPQNGSLSPEEAEAKLCWLKGAVRAKLVDPAQVHAGLDTIRRTIAGAKSPIVINCAGYTNVDGAESEPELAMAVNGAGAGIVAQACAASGKHLVHLSTDYVFDGKARSPYHENHTPNPINLYGKSKLVGEELVSKALPGALIVRSAWLFGPGKLSFVDKVVQKAKEGGPLKVVDDQVGSPTYTPDLARRPH
jgi:dTDP-4-dehydrorhamnose reductase